jgi:hypothetical protein
MLTIKMLMIFGNLWVIRVTHSPESWIWSGCFMATAEVILFWLGYIRILQGSCKVIFGHGLPISMPI